METALKSGETGTKMVLNSQEVAYLLRYKSSDSFLNNRNKLEENGFPKKLPGLNGWSASAVETWINSNGETITPPELSIIVQDENPAGDERP